MMQHCGFAAKMDLKEKNGHIVVPLQILKFRDLKFRPNHLNLHPVWLIITARIRRSSYTFFSCVLLANSPAALWTHRSLWLHLDMKNWSHIYYHHDPSWSIMIYYESFVDAFWTFGPLGLKTLMCHKKPFQAAAGALFFEAPWFTHTVNVPPSDLRILYDRLKS